MFRVCKISGVWYSLEFKGLDADEVENILTLIEEGTPILLCQTLQDIKHITDGERIIDAHNPE